VTPTDPATPTVPGPTETATVTISPFPFALRLNQVTFTQNFANPAVGCAWQGLAGQVYDAAGQPLTGIQVHVFGGNNIDLFATSGTDSRYGPSGWEIPVGTAIDNLIYYVELQTQQGTIISPTVQVQFQGDCARNLAIVDFEQTRPF
jgi:hypothetical protein